MYPGYFSIFTTCRILSRLQKICFSCKLPRIISESKQIFSLSVLEEEVSEPANVQPPQQEPNQRRHTRNRSQKGKIQYYNSRNTGRKAKTGNRPMRRHENSKSSIGQGGEGGRGGRGRGCHSSPLPESHLKHPHENIFISPWRKVKNLQKCKILEPPHPSSFLTNKLVNTPWKFLPITLKYLIYHSVGDLAVMKQTFLRPHL